jgi:FAD/FMN-containing dehydrogenase
MSNRLGGWGNFPVGNVKITSRPTSIGACVSSLRRTGQIARGLGRSYGDASIFESVVKTRGLDRFIDLDQDAGILECEAGVSLNEILEIVTPLGWFLPVTPGTSFVTIGGAIASDVHGKNHHKVGSFCDFVRSFDILLASGEVLMVSRETYPDLFQATCGGMGLTGILVKAKIQLIPIRSSFVDQVIIKTRNLEETLAIFSARSDSTYSVAWIDCLSSGDALGRSHVILGEHSEGALGQDPGINSITAPDIFPSNLLNRTTVKAFNAVYYRRVVGKESKSRVGFRTYFYPLDNILRWNRIYGRRGFLQYQFVIPLSTGLEGMTEILNIISQSGEGSFLAVLKEFGPENKNYLSFPLRGYSLALDFRISDGVLALIERLDEVVLGHGGRVYLSKDSVMSEETFKASYEHWEAFCAVREKYGAHGRFTSNLAVRLGLK